MLAVLIGCAVYIADYRYWFVLRGYRVEAQAQVLEQRLWEVFPQRCLTFWPYLLKDARGLKEFLERDMPVTVDTRMNKLGRFTTKIDWLRAWVKVEWRGKVWSISRDGRMWQYEQGRQNDDDAGKLLWKIPEQGNIQEDLSVQAPMYGVFTSPISLEVIGSFLDDFRGFRWFDAANEITWERRAGMNLFILKLKYGTQDFELYLQREKYPDQNLGLELEELFSRLINEGGNHVIDATYEGKILLRNL